MTAINFPSSPSNGDTHTVGGVTYTYNSAETKWKTTINSNAFLPLSGGTVSGNILMGGEIQHDGDTDTNISFDTDTILFDTAGSERFRVGSAGQLGIGGATYGTSGQFLQSQGASAAPQWATVSASNYTVEATEIASGQYQEFTGIGSDVHRITLLFYDLSCNGSHSPIIQIGDSGGFETSGYTGTGFYDYSTTGGHWSNSSVGWHSPIASAGHVMQGRAVIEEADTTNRIWVCTWFYGLSDISLVGGGGGYKQLSGTLDRIRIGFTGGSIDGGKVRLVTEN